ncbi:tetratricopeptide repeat protein [Striga asiatica]|uniref:Tetratricopeptide repeat protein n=1 Tax=Striga asiatica TaxID=4170 RepID=A0A5A7RDX5_STRAF|nr:tetratricopeptide repeat protein [Striga asiatica]
MDATKHTVNYSGRHPPSSAYRRPPPTAIASDHHVEIDPAIFKVLSPASVSLALREIKWPRTAASRRQERWTDMNLQKKRAVAGGGETRRRQQKDGGTRRRRQMACIRETVADDCPVASNGRLRPKACGGGPTKSRRSALRVARSMARGCGGRPRVPSRSNSWPAVATATFLAVLAATTAVLAVNR